MVNSGDMNTSSSYPSSQNFNFTPTASPLPAQKANYDQFNTDFTGFLGGQETVGQLQDRYSNMFNIPYLQDTAQKQNQQATFFGNQLQAMPEQVNSQTANSMMTQGQKDRLAQAQSMPIAKQFQTAATAANNTNQALGTARTNQNAAINAEQAQQLKMTQPWLKKYDAMTIRNAAENTQWTQSNQWELNRLLANQQSGVTLSEGQQARMEALASQENAFQNSLAYLDKQNQLATDLWG